jgi:predicted PurR-regulated permease PerM
VSRLVSLIALLAIVVLIGVVFFQVMIIFLVPMFLAVVLVIVFRPLHEWFLRLCQGRDRVAAGLTTIAILLIALLPLTLVVSRAAAEGWSIVSRMDPETMTFKIRRLRHALGLEVPPEAVRTSLTAVERDLTLLALDSEIRADDAPPVDPIADLQRNIKRLRDWTAGLEGQSPAELPRYLGRDPLTGLRDVNARLEVLAEQVDSLSANRDGDDFPSQVAEAQVTADQLQRQLLGDEMTAWLRAKANPSPEDLKVVRTWLQETLAPAALQVTPILGKLVFGFLIMIASLYYFLADGPKMLNTIMRLSPLDERYEKQLLSEFTRISRAVVVATLLTALVQGILAGIGFKLAGLNAVFLLTVLTMFGAMVPFVGAAAVWIPSSIYLVLEGQHVAGGLLALYGLCIVSTSDNIIKPMILHGQSNLHPLLALVSVLGGVTALGPIGVFVGPMAVVFLQVVLTMLNNEPTILSARPGRPGSEGEDGITDPVEGVDEVPATGEPDESASTERAPVKAGNGVASSKPNTASDPSDKK